MADRILYRFYDSADQLLYVGISTNMLLRLQSHSYQQPWWQDAVRIDLQRFADREELEAAEREAIHFEKPKYNVVHAPPRRPCSPMRRQHGQGSVFQRADGMWVASFEDGATRQGKRRQRRVYGKTREVVEQKMAAERSGQ